MTKPVNAAVAAVEGLARRNLGLFTVSDADRCGVSRNLLKYHTRPGGRWSRLLPRVYELKDLPPLRQRPLLGALVWAGPQAVLSHRAAAAVLGLDGIGAATPEVWAPRVRNTIGVIVHRGVVPPDDVTWRGPLRLTNLRRTVVDLAGVVEDDTLEVVIESAFRRDPRLQFDPRPGTPGSVRLRRVLRRRPPDEPPTDSELETRYLQVIRGAGVPPPVRQHRVFNEDGSCLGRLDVCWPDVGLWVELDGRATHEQPKALLSDRHRQNELATRLQWLPLRFTWDDVTRRPTATGRFTEAAYRRRVELARA